MIAIIVCHSLTIWFISYYYSKDHVCNYCML